MSAGHDNFCFQDKQYYFVFKSYVYPLSIFSISSLNHIDNNNLKTEIRLFLFYISRFEIAQRTLKFFCDQDRILSSRKSFFCRNDLNLRKVKNRNKSIFWKEKISKYQLRFPHQQNVGSTYDVFNFELDRKSDHNDNNFSG